MALFFRNETRRASRVAPVSLCKGCSKYTCVLLDNFNIVQRQPTMEDADGGPRSGERQVGRNSGFQRLNGGTAAARVNSIEV